MATQTDKTPHKLGANRNDPAHKSRQARSASESCDLHEDRGAVKSKLGRSHGNITTGTHGVSSPAPGRQPYFPPPPRPLTEHNPAAPTLPVQLCLHHDGARSVSVAGSFNDWQPDRTPLQRNSEGAWEADLQLAPGEYEYRFVVDGQWSDDPLACRHVPNPFGGMNAVLHVHGG